MRHDAGELEAETAALLEMEKVSDVDFTPAVLACLPQEDEAWSISPQERAHRRDFTSTRYTDAYDVGTMDRARGSGKGRGMRRGMTICRGENSLIWLLHSSFA